MSWWEWLLASVVVLVLGVATYDVLQRRHAILRVFPVLGHLRFLLEAVGPELRQYIVTDNNSDKPFSRDQRRYVYTTAKQQNRLFGFGTDNDLEGGSNYLIIKHAGFPLPDLGPGEPGTSPEHAVPSAKVLGPRRPGAFRMPSVVNISGMSYGSLSRVAVEALNRGAALAGCVQGTGEGGLTPHHRHGGELIWQIGTGYFGCRDAAGHFSVERFRDVLDANPQVRAVEVKLSQGAKPGIGGLLPAAKVSAEVAAVRGVTAGEDCVSPPAHSAFTDTDGLLDFVEQLAQVSERPVGIKSAVGDERFFDELARLMARDERGVDFITIDGGEGGTGAGPLTFTDHVALPFKLGFSRVYRRFVEAGVAERVVFIGSGKLGVPHNALLAFALGCDAINVGREAMLAIGCIQAQRCHTDRCPTGVTTHSRWRMRGLDPELKSVRAANYICGLRGDLLQVARACGEPHPALVTLDHFELLGDRFEGRPAPEVFDYDTRWGLPSLTDQEATRTLMQGRAGITARGEG